MNVGTAVPDWPTPAAAASRATTVMSARRPAAEYVPNLASGPTTGLVRAGLADRLQDGRSAY
jgi:hypothetical protein